MRILFVYTNIGTHNPRNYQHGLASLAAVAIRAGHETALISLDSPPTEAEFLRAVARHSPDLVGITANSPQWSAAKHLGRWVKGADPQLPVVFGGTHPTTRPTDVLTSGATDYIVRGEGEEALLELVAALTDGRAVDGIANLGFLRGGDPVINEVRPLIDDLDRLPPAQRELFDFQAIVDANLGEAPYMAGRGCPYACTYCCNSFLQRIYAGKGRTVRFLSPERVVADLTALRRDYRVEAVYFQDDTFTLDKRWLRRFAELYAAEVGLPYRAQARVDLVDEEMVDLLADSGCRHINFGIEAGDERIRREVMKRRISDDQIRRAFDLARSRGLKLWSYNIIGSPGEGEAEIRRTIDINRELEPDHVQVSIFNPYPGTELYERCVAEALIDPKIADHGLPTTFFVELPAIERRTVSDERLKELYDEFVQLGLALAAKRDPRGDLDFAAHLPTADVETPSPAHVNLQALHMHDEERLCLFAHPPSRVSFLVPVPAPSRLRFAITLNPEVWARDLDGVRFIVEVDGEELFRRELNPAAREDDRGWHDVELAIAANGEPRRTIAFVTEPVDRPDFGWALWGRPHLIHVGAGEAALGVA